ncbi:toprim domain-containing protein, partial [Serratia microhaemolytica]|uniref:toprim domain-containing protein n=1 Tax=Serratia microhaemolytica TaxID=2675110 RepID=UPI001F0CC213
NGVTADHWHCFAANGVKQVLIAFDNDAAGNSAALKLAEALREKGIEPWRVIFPAGMDANDYLLANEQKALAFQLLLDQALPMAADGALAAAVKQVEAAEKVAAVESASDFAAAPSSSSSSSSSSSAACSEPGLVSEWLDNGDLCLTLLNHQWRLRGLTERSRHSLALKLNVQVLDLVSGVLFCDHLDLLSARSRQGYARLAALELGCDEASLRRALGRVLLWVEQYQTEQKARVQAEASAEAAPVLSADQQSEALALLRSPQLLARITQDLAACGVVGERSNLLAA